MDDDGRRNIVLFLGAMMAISTFWLVVLGVNNNSSMQLMGSLATLAISVFCFRAYFASLRKERGRRRHE